MNDSTQKHWHHLHAEEMLELLATDAQTGLDQAAVEERQNLYGLNSLAKRAGQGP